MCCKNTLHVRNKQFWIFPPLPLQLMSSFTASGCFLRALCLRSWTRPSTVFLLLFFKWKNIPRVITFSYFKIKSMHRIYNFNNLFTPSLVNAGQELYGSKYNSAVTTDFLACSCSSWSLSLSSSEIDWVYKCSSIMNEFVMCSILCKNNQKTKPKLTDHLATWFDGFSFI